MNIFLFKLGSVSYWDPLHYLWIWLAAILALNHIHIICINLAFARRVGSQCVSHLRLNVFLSPWIYLGVWISRGSLCEGVCFESAVTRLPLKISLEMQFAEHILCLRFILFLFNQLPSISPLRCDLQKSIISAFGFFLYPITLDWPWRCDFPRSQILIFMVPVFLSLALPGIPWFYLQRGNIIVYCACVLIFFFHVTMRIAKILLPVCWRKA